MSTAPELRDFVRDAALEPTAVAARRRAFDVLPEPLSYLGEISRLTGHLIGGDRNRGSGTGNGNDAVVALGWVLQCAHELVAGVRALLDADNLYGAFALTRQLVEVEYLAWASSDASADFADWLRSDASERRKRWQPRHLRERSAGRFDVADYAQHCEVGGHPTPDGLRRLIGSQGEHRDVIRQLAIWEVANHGFRVWGHCRNSPHLDLDRFTSKQPWFPNVRAAHDEWRRVDQIGRSGPAQGH